MAETTPPTPDVPPVADAKAAPAEAPVARRDLRWYLVGFGSVGLLVGFFAGLSDSPAVSTLLPLILATIGGTGGRGPGSFKRSSPAESTPPRPGGETLGLFGNPRHPGPRP